jgi:hypothetical protein
MKLLQKKSVNKRLALWVLLLLPLCSSSNSYIFGYTGNAAFGGNTWSMTTPVLGATVQEGMDISGVIYTYNPIKELADDFTVTVQNENAAGDGYIFQDIEDFSGKHPIKIRKVLQLPYVPIENFGRGSIATTGVGSIEDASVIYMYRFDACRNPQNDPSCPDYIPPLPPPIKIYDALDDESVKFATKETDKDLLDDDEDNKQSNEEEEDIDRLEVMLGIAANAFTIANGVTQSSLINTMNSVNMDTYYVARIPSKVYREPLVLKDQGISDNRKVLRSLSNDRLHQTMIEEQYK